MFDKDEILRARSAHQAQAASAQHETDMAAERLKHLTEVSAPQLLAEFTRVAQETKLVSYTMVDATAQPRFFAGPRRFTVWWVWDEPHHRDYWERLFVSGDGRLWSGHGGLDSELGGYPSTVASLLRDSLSLYTTGLTQTQLEEGQQKLQGILENALKKPLT